MSIYLQYLSFYLIRMVQTMKNVLLYFTKQFIILLKVQKPNHYGYWITNLRFQMRILCYTPTEEELQKRMVKDFRIFTKICWKQLVSSEERPLTDYMLYIKAPILHNYFFSLYQAMSLYLKQDYLRYTKILCSCSTSKKEYTCYGNG